jgi:hypothetical protein
MFGFLRKVLGCGISRLLHWIPATDVCFPMRRFELTDVPGRLIDDLISDRLKADSATATAGCPVASCEFLAPEPPGGTWPNVTGIRASQAAAGAP